MTPSLADQAARARITGALDETLFVEAGADSGKTRSLVERVVALVHDDIPMRNIAAITFTEKAAAELRDRIRRALEDERAAADAPLRTRLQAALHEVDAAAVSTLHAFAQRILSEHPIEARLPPNVAVLDEVASDIEFEDRWRAFRDGLLAEPALRRCLLLAFAADVRLADIRHLAKQFEANWDLVADPQRIPWPASEPPELAVEGLVAGIQALLDRRGECSDDDDKLCIYLTDQIEPYLDQLRQAPDEFETLRLLKQDKPTFRCGHGLKGNWPDKGSIADDLRALGADRSRLAGDVALACLRRIAVEVARFTVRAAELRRTSGRLAFHDLLVLARDLLRGHHGVDVRNRLRQRYQRLLLDEFQDTDPIQIELAVLIASADPDAAGKAWRDVGVQAGRLFFVGDPKQSIYRFRRADIELFLAARDVFGEPVALTTNFRASPAVIGWVNHVFAQLIAHEPGSQPAYQALHPAPARTDPPVGPPVAVLGAAAHAADSKADELREREAADVAGAVLAALGWQVSEPGPDGGPERWRAASPGDITILLPARTSLAELERALDARDIPYRAEASSLVYATREVRDLMATLRALADPTDQLALVTALRSPVLGCGDDDLFTYKVRHGGVWHLLADPPADLDDAHPVVAAMGYLRALHAEVAWLAPAELADRIARDRRLFELGYAAGRPRDLWRRLRFVIDQARAWSEAEGGTLREYLEWARLQASESARVAETILPETDDESVRIMTIHAAKGLQFPITILSGMTTATRGFRSRVEVAFPPGEPVALKVGAGLVTPEFEAFQPIDEQMDFHERLRLLYVACTRAKDHLVVSLHRKQRRNPPDEDRKLTNAELVAGACADLDLPEVSADGATVSRPPSAVGPEPLPELAVWEAERSAALDASGRWRSVGASDVALLAAAPGLDVDEAEEAEGDEGEAGDEDVEAKETAAGAAKAPRDLELPPWQKGRYGTAIGRAVHAVLQTIDLATGEGLQETAAAQAAAEGVIGREADIARLARAALAAPSVREALGCPRWRETYVAAPVGDRTLEGYIDLLYRTAGGLVVADYKTASSTADLDRRMAAYRAQGGAYALAVELATGEPVARVVFIFLTPAGAVEVDLDDLAHAKLEVRAVLERVPEATPVP
ncbi:MAG TPA: UvrD-helicase domain-containing protein [Egibacteraceae bacterium]|nr:UvrD-helicase domain-containing protein [Egibacteraceae bacterium]